ncbi:lytic polysaccharide monooxygenase [Streptomyces sp. GD-15H]
MDSDFIVQLHDQVSHGADHFLGYVTRQGFDPTTQALTWDGLPLVTTTGSYGTDQNCSISVSTSGFSGRHLIPPWIRGYSVLQGGVEYGLLWSRAEGCDAPSGWRAVAL